MKFTGTEKYVATDDLQMAVNAAIALQRPLLILLVMYYKSNLVQNLMPSQLLQLLLLILLEQIKMVQVQYGV